MDNCPKLDPYNQCVKEHVGNYGNKYKMHMSNTSKIPEAANENYFCFFEFYLNPNKTYNLDLFRKSSAQTDEIIDV